MMRHFLAVLCVFLSSYVYCLEVSINHAVFHNDSTHYVEIYTRFLSSSLQYIVTEDSTSVQSSVEYLVYIESEGKILTADKYLINSPLSNEASDYWDLKRFTLPVGLYKVHLQYVDQNNIIDTLKINWDVEVKERDGRVNHSDVLLISDVFPTAKTGQFCKNGFCFEPLSFNLLNPDQNKLFAFMELYDVDSEISDEYYIQYYARQVDSSYQKDYTYGYRKMKASNAEAILLEYNCEDLPSGNYDFVIELHKKDKSLVTSLKRSFAVYHPFVDYRLQYHGDSKFETSFVQFLDEDQLDYALKAIYPRLGNHMTETANYIVRSKEIKSKRYFLHHFWSGFSESNPKAVYDKYMEVVKAIDIRYANNVGHGFETDRGYYFLKYGRPDDLIQVEDEPSAPPYEIWIYNYMPETGETNVRFLFYNPSLSANDFVLLHSTCRGERNNPRWEVDLYSDDFNATSTNYIDARRVNDGFNRNARFFFSDAR